MLAAVILAAGESRRMGTSKALLPYRGKTFLTHLLEVTRHPRIGVHRVVVGAHAAEIRNAAALPESSVLENPDWEKGQLTSIHAAVRSLLGGQTDGILLCLVDHPLISAALVDTLINAFYTSRKPIVLPTYRGKRGHPVIFSSTLYDDLLAAPLDTGARAVVWQHASEVQEVPTEEEGVVLNLNDPEIYLRVVGEPPPAGT